MVTGVAVVAGAVMLEAASPKMKKLTVAMLEMTAGSVAGFLVYVAPAAEFKKKTEVVMLTLDPRPVTGIYHVK
jgi:hypothetical protein